MDDLADSADACRHVFYIGAGGMYFSDYSGTPCFSIGRDSAGNTETVRPWYSDFTIGDRSNGSYSLVFHRNVELCTDDENGTGRTITIDARTRGNGSSVAITVSGSGMVKVNKACYNATQPTVTVTDTATLAFKPGASLGTGATTVNSGATFEVVESGKVTLGGDLMLKDGATLKFTFTERGVAPVLDVNSKAVTFGDQKQIKVSLLGTERPARSAYGAGGKCYLTQNGNFAAATVAKADDCAYWVKDVGIEGGNIYAEIIPRGLIFFVN